MHTHKHTHIHTHAYLHTYTQVHMQIYTHTDTRARYDLPSSMLHLRLPVQRTGADPYRNV